MGIYINWPRFVFKYFSISTSLIENPRSGSCLTYISRGVGFNGLAVNKWEFPSIGRCWLKISEKSYSLICSLIQGVKFEFLYLCMAEFLKFRIFPKNEECMRQLTDVLKLMVEF